MKHIHLIAFSLLFATPVIGQSPQDDVVSNSEVVIERIDEIVYQGGAMKPGGYSIQTTVPTGMAAMVNRMTGIECNDVGMKIRMIDDGDSFKMGFTAGDSFSAKGKGEIGRTRWNHDFSYRYKQLFKKSHGSSYVAEGAYEFNNKLNKKRCFLTCRIRGNRDENGKLTGIAEWTGPFPF